MLISAKPSSKAQEPKTRLPQTKRNYHSYLTSSFSLFTFTSGLSLYPLGFSFSFGLFFFLFLWFCSLGVYSSPFFDSETPTGASRLFPPLAPPVRPSVSYLRQCSTVVAIESEFCWSGPQSRLRHLLPRLLDLSDKVRRQTSGRGSGQRGTLEYCSAGIFNFPFVFRETCCFSTRL